MAPQADVAKQPAVDKDLRRVALQAVAILGTGLAAGAMLVLGWHSPVRVVLALLFLLFGPGLAVAELLEVNDLVQRLAIATGVSLALETVVGVVLVYAGAYSVGLTFAIVLALSAVLLAIAYIRAMRVPRAGSAGEAS